MAGYMSDVSNLSTLLTESRLAQDKSTAAYNQPPASSAPTVVKTGKQQSSVPSQTTKANSKDIWAPEEILTEDALIDWKDDRPAPRYEFSYKQSVGTEDTFLGMGDKTPLTSDCTHLVVKIHFPKATMKELDLNVTKNRIKAASKSHHLYTYLPVNVDPDNGKAKFDTAKEVLSITLPIVHDL
jgi:hypothetical protein